MCCALETVRQADEEEKLAVFRKIRDGLVDRLNAWCAERDREAGAGHAPGGSA